MSVRARPWLAVLSLSVVTAAVTLWAIAPIFSASPLLALWNVVATLAFLAAAVLLADEPRQVPNAVLMWAIGLFWMVNCLDLHPVGPLPFTSWVAGPLVFAFLAAALLRYPETRLGRLEKVYVLAAGAAVLAFRLLSVAVSRPEWHHYPVDPWWPAVAPDPALAVLVDRALDALAVAFALGFAGLLVRRVRRATGLDRRLVTPVVVAGAAISVVVLCDVVSRLAAHDGQPLVAALVVEAAAMLAVPGAFLASAVRRRLHRTIVSNLILSLPRNPTPEDVEAALRRELADPELRILYWVPEFSRHVAASGDPLDAADPPDRLRRTITSADGVDLADVLVDPSMHRHPEVLDATLSAAALWLENARLQAAVRAQLADIRESRRRVRRAGETERRRIERDLHDGAQQRLLALKMRLAVAGVEAGSEAERALIRSVTDELQDAVTELRDLARGLRPEVLAERGLPDAVREVADRCPLPVAVTLPDRRWEPGVEAAAYFAVCEALSNVLKHAGATAVSIVGTDDGERLALEIADDGHGGAAVEPGGGLAGVRDRVAALDGRMSVEGDVRGTRVLVTMPVREPAVGSPPAG